MDSRALPDSPAIGQDQLPGRTHGRSKASKAGPRRTRSPSITYPPPRAKKLAKRARPGNACAKSLVINVLRSQRQ